MNLSLHQLTSRRLWTKPINFSRNLVSIPMNKRFELGDYDSFEMDVFLLYLVWSYEVKLFYKIISVILIAVNLEFIVGKLLGKVFDK